MEYVRYVAVLRRHALLIVLLTILGAGSSAFLSLRQHKVYRATATLSINPAAPAQSILYLQQMVNNSSFNAMQQLASSYDAYLHLTSFSQVVSTKYGTPISPDQISTDLVGNTPYFHINVTAGDPLVAKRLADNVASEFVHENTGIQLSGQDAAQQAKNTQLLSHIQHDIDSASKRSDALQKKVDSGKATPAQQQQLAIVTEQLNSLISAQKALTQGSSPSAQLNTATLIAPAPAPSVPIAPLVRQNITFGTLAGLVMALALAFLLDYLDYSLRSPEDVESATGQLPLAVIGVIGGRRDRRRKGRSPSSAAVPALPTVELQPAPARSSRNGNGNTGSAGAPEPALVTVQHPLDPVSEAFRSLRTNLAFSTLAKPVHTLVITSVLPSEGKSTTAANLAVVMAQSGKRVIIVDTDLRRPSLHRVFSVRNSNGFTDMLLDNADIAASLQPTVVPNLSVVTSGPLPPNPAELLSSEAILQLIRALSDRADMVIFDTPPMGVLTDAVVLSTRVEGTLLVCRSGSARPGVVTKGMEALRKVGGHPLGVVLNMVDVSSLRDYSYYYYYARSGDYGNNKDEAAKTSRAGSATR